MGDWEVIQQKTFTKWCNAHLGKRKESIEDLQRDFSDGKKLIILLEVLSDESLGRYNQRPIIDIQKIENINKALSYLQKKGVKLVAISAENFIECNLKLILGAIWTIILRFAIQDISEDELSARDALLLWCKKKTRPYDNVKVTNFTTTWQNGLAFCALIHAHRPDLIDYHSLDPANHEENLQLAFDIAEKELDIPQLLDVDDIARVVKPDERSIITYVAQYYHVFASSNKKDDAARRVGKLVDLTATIDQMKANYETSAKALMEWVEQKVTSLGEREFDNSLSGVRTQMSDFKTYQTEEKPPKTAEKLNVESLLNEIALKLKAASRPPFVPSDGVRQEDIENAWAKLNDAETARYAALREELARQQKLQQLKTKFDSGASKLREWIAAKKEYLDKEEKVDSVAAAQTKSKILDAFDQEYKKSVSRVEGLESVSAQYADLNGPDKDAIADEVKAVRVAWEALSLLSDIKRSDLDEKLLQQQEMERLRKEWAQKATDHKKHNAEVITGVEASKYGDTLEAVEGYQAELDSSDSEIKSSGDERKAALDDLWSRLQEAGVTDNRYTVLLDTDVAAMADQLDEALKRRRDAYAKELEHQRLLEAKRKEFAEKAQAFVDHLAERKAKIAGLQGDIPSDLIKSVESEYANGEPEEASHQALSDLQQEMARMGITSNHLTEFTLPQLTGLSEKLAQFVRDLIAALEEEDAMKNEYVEKAQALVEWVDSRLVELSDAGFDNTLEGVRQLKGEFYKYKTTTRAPKNVDKVKLNELFQRIEADLQERNRPSFSPREGLAPPAVDAKWKDLDVKEGEYGQRVEAELARQEKLQATAKQYSQGHQELIQWTAEKEEYLKAHEEMNTLDEARLAVILFTELSDFTDEEKKKAKLQSLADELNEDNYHLKDDINAKAAALDSAWENLNTLSVSKRERLLEQQQVQQEREDLRIEYAEKAEALQTECADKTEKVDDDRAFGQTLGAVEAYGATVEAHESEVKHSVKEKRADVNVVAAKLDDHGVTDNVHTSIGQEDLTRMEQDLEDRLQARREAYDAELARQRENEEKRKHFAATAQEFVDSLAARQSAISSLEGEPEPLIAAIGSEYNSGAPENEKLATLAELQDDLNRAGVRDNAHTEYTVSNLRTRNGELSKFVKKLIDELRQENRMKQDYVAKAAAVREWAEGRVPEVEKRNFDNTLEGARLKKREWHEYKNGLRARKDVEKSALKPLFAKVSAKLEKQDRPAFAPPTGLSLSDIDELWESLKTTESAYDADLASELERQERLDKLVKQYNAEHEEITRWADRKEEYLTADEHINTLDDARLAVVTLDMSDHECDGTKGRVTQADALAKEIDSLNYVNKSDINAKVAAMNLTWEKLQSLSVSKRERLLEQQQVQQEREDLRIEYAEKAEALKVFNKDSTEKVDDDRAFGQTLVAVESYQAELESSDAEIKHYVKEKRADVNVVAAKLDDHGVTDNVHTSIGQGDLTRMEQDLEDRLQARREAYDAELARQRENEEKRKHFAATAQEFVDSLAARQSAISSLEGEPEPLIAAIESEYNSGAPENEKLATLAELQDDLNRAGVRDNAHTEYTVRNLRARNGELSKFVKKLIDELHQENKQKSEYTVKAGKLVEWLEATNNKIGNPRVQKKVTETRMVPQKKKVTVKRMVRVAKPKKAKVVAAPVTDATTEPVADVSVPADEESALVDDASVKPDSTASAGADDDEEEGVVSPREGKKSRSSKSSKKKKKSSSSRSSKSKKKVSSKSSSTKSKDKEAGAEDTKSSSSSKSKSRRKHRHRKTAATDGDSAAPGDDDKDAVLSTDDDGEKGAETASEPSAEDADEEEQVAAPDSPAAPATEEAETVSEEKKDETVDVVEEEEDDDEEEEEFEEVEQEFEEEIEEMVEESFEKTVWVDAGGEGASIFDNTLEGARRHKNEWASYKRGEKSHKGLQKINVKSLHDKVSQSLADRNRPEFATPDGLDPAAIDSQWDTMESSEHKFEENLAAELQRQEKLHELVKVFNSDADDLEAWSNKTEDYLRSEDTIDSLQAARVAVMTLDHSDSEYTQTNGKLSKLRDLEREIIEFDYINAVAVKERGQGLSEKYAALSGLASDRRTRLVGALVQEEKKEDLRVQFANLAVRLQKYVRSQKETLRNDHRNFGHTPDAVFGYADQLASNEESVHTSASDKKAEIQAVAQELQGLHVTDNSHTATTTADIEALVEDLEQALAARRSAYEEECEKQRGQEAKRKEFAGKASEFVQWVDAQQSALNGIAGTPDEKADRVREIHADGAEGNAQIAKLSKMDAEMRSVGIYANPHSKYTLPVLESRNKQYQEAVAILLSSLAEEKDMEQRAATQQAEWEEKQRLDEQTIAFEQQAQALDTWSDATVDALEEPIVVETPAEVEALQAALEPIAEQHRAKEPEYNALVEVDRQLGESGVATSLKNVTTKWDAVGRAQEVRKAELEEVLATISAHDSLCSEFATQAQRFQRWNAARRSELDATASESDLQVQLDQVRELKAVIMADGPPLLEETSDLSQKVETADVSSSLVSRHTTINVPSLKVELDDLNSTCKKQESLLERELLQKKNSTVTAEEVDEFKSCFEHFAKGGDSLNRLQFKSCLSSLGEDPTDAEVNNLLKELGDPVSFDAFATYMSSRRSDSSSMEEILSSFSELADGKDFILEADMKMGQLPAEKVDYLVKEMPAYPGVDGGLDYKEWAKNAFSR
eukprot:TRINITY_DN805_c0_g1_i1.p1 TRINITY_DN805_c0_g1~~TRINITY_DN805_c0_g1_i1.p1  ORF type:complete len:2712 (-),score=1016.99 TRINITY_DN805_c0_g1_i1:134-8269(-)